MEARPARPRHGIITIVISLPFLNEDFDADALDSRLHWLNEPSHWRIDNGLSALVVDPEADTDFWRKTHYGFEADSGHFLSASLAGDFAVITHARFFPRHQYDQAGLMVRANSDFWIKTSVEHEPEESPKLGVVVTNHAYSDWSMQDFDRARESVWLQISRKANDFTVSHSDDGQRWRLLRMTHLHIDAAAKIDCGIYACSPKGAGFRAEFGLLRITRE